MSETMKISAVAPWFGSNREGRTLPGRLLGKLAWCGVPFCGGMSELPHIDTRGGVANDLHRHVINLAKVVRDPALCDQMIAILRRAIFHPDELAEAQAVCRERDTESGAGGEIALFREMAPDLDALSGGMVGWAAAYFIAVWMGRGGFAGKIGELRQTLSTRWTASGGSSAKRFESAVESLPAWSAALRRWEFTTLDAIAFLQSVKDAEGHGIYCDAPWVEEGECYVHAVRPEFHTTLARELDRFTRTRVVVRYGDCPLIRDLYVGDRWRWVEVESRNQQGNGVAEVLIVKNGEEGVGA